MREKNQPNFRPPGVRIRNERFLRKAAVGRNTRPARLVFIRRAIDSGTPLHVLIGRKLARRVKAGMFPLISGGKKVRM